MLTTSRWALGATFLCALAAPAWACLWYYGKNSKGEAVSVESLHGGPKAYVPKLTSNPEHESRKKLDTSKEPADDADFKVRSDYAATLVYQGKAVRAAEILESIEKAHPGEYVVAVNLGTAYELSGENEKALHWIREGIRRNADSHYGTEWLHVKILEAKIAAAKDPEWIKIHSVLDLDFGTGDLPVMPTQWPIGGAAYATKAALEYQLHERLAFVPPPDPLIAGMIADLGNLLGLMETVDHAVPVYDLALTYKPVNADLIARRRAHAVQFAGPLPPPTSKQDVSNRILSASILGGAVVLLCIAFYLKKKTTPA